MRAKITKKMVCCRIVLPLLATAFPFRPPGCGLSCPEKRDFVHTYKIETPRLGVSILYAFTMQYQ